jgi:hypothetical protein
VTAFTVQSSLLSRQGEGAMLSRHAYRGTARSVCPRHVRSREPDDLEVGGRPGCHALFRSTRSRGDPSRGQHQQLKEQRRRPTELLELEFTDKRAIRRTALGIRRLSDRSPPERRHDREHRRRSLGRAASRAESATGTQSCPLHGWATRAGVLLDCTQLQYESGSAGHAFARRDRAGWTRTANSGDSGGLIQRTTGIGSAAARRPIPAAATEASESRRREQDAADSTFVCRVERRSTCHRPGDESANQATAAASGSATRQLISDGRFALATVPFFLRPLCC